MQTTFKLKLQNALNSLNFTDADSPALIVGGRRRNRKKRRTRHGRGLHVSVIEWSYYCNDE